MKKAITFASLVCLMGSPLASASGAVNSAVNSAASAVSSAAESKPKTTIMVSKSKTSLGIEVSIRETMPVEHEGKTYQIEQFGAVSFWKYAECAKSPAYEPMKGEHIVFANSGQGLRTVMLYMHDYNCDGKIDDSTAYIEGLDTSGLHDTLNKHLQMQFEKSREVINRHLSINREYNRWLNEKADLQKTVRRIIKT